MNNVWHQTNQPTHCMYPWLSLSSKINKSWKFWSIIIILSNPSVRAGYDTSSIFKQSLTGLISKFSFSKSSCLTKAEEHSLSFYLPIAGGRIIGFISFPRVLTLCEMQSVWSRIWTRVAVSIFYDDNNYTKCHYRSFLFQLWRSGHHHLIDDPSPLKWMHSTCNAEGV